ncbi:type I glutamate--ammonia ligase [Actinophytocola algeriensis]|uniref:Glutamine synthetase n=1 Tax=Actinophytocola algeriensis TaxID=1768010 RepID=A0A7W7Q6X3_9PSEU|nr:glutamine synthetase family protein [Actinophytocola algeriensis]MBB4907781.1 glutamine synthetase [Actinophytocola algeriensis]MBE1479811.1 glutamine synthetase [Actinophytocola algeriensis]
MTPEELRAAGVTLVELSFVDNAGITRVKAVPLDRLPTAVGASPCFEAFGSDDVMVAGRYLGGPDGDLRLTPDMSRLVALSAQPGWGWVPADKYDQDGTRFVACQRAFAARQTEALAAHGLRALAAYEHEWILGRGDADGFAPAFDGPAYGQIRLEQVAGYASELVADLTAQGLVVEQFHPEYAVAQLEVSVAPNDPVAAADDAVLVRHTIRSRSLAHGWRASFSPSVDPDGAGSGAHLHLSVHDAGGSLMAGGDGPCGLRTEGEAFLAGVLRELPALVAIGCGHPVSFLRLQPSRWAGIWQAWGHETRETALRLVTGPSANAELKCFDATANPYLLIGSVLAAGLAGVTARLRLPEPVTGDPATGDGSVPRLPSSASEAATALESSAVLAAALGPALHDAIVTVRRAEAERCSGLEARALTSAVLWRW